MHVVIINGSPRNRQYSNTNKIIHAFVKGLEGESGSTSEIYCLSSPKDWSAARDAYLSNEKIIFALPMYVECVPSLMLEFLDTLPSQRQTPAELSFILHGGFTRDTSSGFASDSLPLFLDNLAVPMADA